MAKADDIDLILAYDVPFVWFDAKRGRERFGLAMETLPMRIRGVTPASVENRLERFSIKGHGDVANASFSIEGQRHECYRGCPLTSLASPGEWPWPLSFAAARLPSAISPPPGEMRRAARRMRAAAVDYPIEAAAARVRRVVAEEIVHDGSYLYRLSPDSPERKAEAEAAWAFLKRCTLVMQAGERVLRSGETGTALAENLSRLRRITVAALLDTVDAQARPAGDEIIRDAARILSRTHPVERDRRRMERIARTPAAFEEMDVEAFDALIPKA